VDGIRGMTAQKVFRRSLDFADNRQIMALLRGSRQQEGVRIRPSMVEGAGLFQKQFPEYQIAVAGVDNLTPELYSPAINAGIPVIQNRTYDLLTHSRLALVTSGTATLETALFKVPQVVAYKTSGFTYLIAKLLIKVPYISLVNLVAEKLLAEELIQKECSGENLYQALIRLNGRYAEVVNDCEALYQTVRTEGASIKAAKLMVEDLQLKTI